MRDEGAVRYNVMKVTSLLSFANIKGGFQQGRKDVFFVRCIGYDQNYIKNIQQMDQLYFSAGREGEKHYVRILELPKHLIPNEAMYYTNAFALWKENGNNGIVTKVITAAETGKLAASALTKASEVFSKFTPQSNASMVKNFIIKALYWLDQTTAAFFEGWSQSKSYKYIFCGKAKKQEYIFLYLLTLMGIDVLILSPEGELTIEAQLLSLSYRLSLSSIGNITIPPYQKIQAQNQCHSVRMKKPRSELAFEELARLGASIVMITVHNEKGKAVGGGSGIMVSKDGYILTNHHVVCRGISYSVRIEEEDEIYKTDELIKYNTVLDLALLRIDRELTPLPIYGGAVKLVRGQKVVAIGSPLGLFNSVSDGIISGFRRFDEVDMIQFTAPISHGSSGGALLNMYGEVIGISSAGFDSGQNINLAIEYQDIKQFLGGFL
jgi:hypothetical protein